MSDVAPPVPIASNERVPDDRFYLVSDGSIVEMNINTLKTRRLEDAEAESVRRWILRER